MILECLVDLQCTGDTTGVTNTVPLPRGLGYPVSPASPLLPRLPISPGSPCDPTGPIGQNVD